MPRRGHEHVAQRVTQLTHNKKQNKHWYIITLTIKLNEYIIFRQKRDTATSGWPQYGYFLNNRHCAEWRLLLLTRIVMVKPNTWIVIVIGMRITSFRNMMANRLRFSSVSPALWGIHILAFISYPVNIIFTLLCISVFIISRIRICPLS